MTTPSEPGATSFTLWTDAPPADAADAGPRVAVSDPPPPSTSSGSTPSSDVGSGPTAPRWGRDRLSFYAFVVAITACVPFLVAESRFAWFANDDWYVLAGRDAGQIGDYFRPHEGHWITLPVVAFQALWSTVGLHSYRPYQLMAIATHLGVAVLLRAILRRQGVDGWIATIAAVGFACFGAGQENVVWAFQITIEGAMALGLVHLLLADHDGPLDRRDWLGLVAGAGALMCSGVGLVMVGVVGVAVLLRRGWRLALFHVAPLLAMFGIWYLIERPSTGTSADRVPAGKLADWITQFTSGVFIAVGHFTVVGALLGALVVIGLVLVAVRASSYAELRRSAAVPLALVAGFVVFISSVANERWFVGFVDVRSGRYLWVGAALLLPVIAIAADAISRRFPPAYLVVLALLLVAIPWNARQFTQMPFPWGRAYFLQEQAILLGAPNTAFARDVSPDVHPDPSFLLGDDVTVGWLLAARDAGKLPDIEALPPDLEAQLRIRLGVAQRRGGAPTQRCTVYDAPLDLTPAKGDIFVLGSAAVVSLLQNGRPVASVGYQISNGRRLTIELDDLELRVSPIPRSTTYQWCE